MQGTCNFGTETVYEVLQEFSGPDENETDVFPEFREGQSLMSYLNCFFYKINPLNSIIRELGDGKRGECGIGGEK